MELQKPVRNQLVSEIEQGAKRAAVEAVEARWKRSERIRRRAELRRVLRNASSLLILVAIAAGGVYWWYHRDCVDGLIDNVKRSVSASEKPVEEAVPRMVPAPLLDDRKEKTVVEKVVDTVLIKPDPAAEQRERYLRLVSVFSESAVGPWKQVPVELLPKNAPPGTVYHALVPRHPAGYDIYAMTTAEKGVTLDLLSPIADPVRVAAADFKASCAGTVYLIEKDGKVYWDGKATEKSAKELQAKLRTRNGGDIMK